jgi:hypothetical protein
MTAFRPFINLATGVWVAARAAGKQTCSPGMPAGSPTGQIDSSERGRWIFGG